MSAASVNQAFDNAQATNEVIASILDPLTTEGRKNVVREIFRTRCHNRQKLTQLVVRTAHVSWKVLSTVIALMFESMDIHDRARIAEDNVLASQLATISLKQSGFEREEVLPDVLYNEGLDRIHQNVQSAEYCDLTEAFSDMVLQPSMDNEIDEETLAAFEWIAWKLEGNT